MSNNIIEGVPFTITDEHLRSSTGSIIVNLWSQVRRVINVIEVNANHKVVDENEIVLAVSDAHQQWIKMIDQTPDSLFSTCPPHENREYFKSAFIKSAIYLQWGVNIRPQDKLRICKQIAPEYFDTEANSTTVIQIGGSVQPLNIKLL